VERTFAWLNQFRRVRVRYEKRADIHAAFLSLGCALDLVAVAAKRPGPWDSVRSYEASLLRSGPAPLQ